MFKDLWPYDDYIISSCVVICQRNFKWAIFSRIIWCSRSVILPQLDVEISITRKATDNAAWTHLTGEERGVQCTKKGEKKKNSNCKMNYFSNKRKKYATILDILSKKPFCTNTWKCVLAKYKMISTFKILELYHCIIPGIWLHKHKRHESVKGIKKSLLQWKITKLW